MTPSGTRSFLRTAIVFEGGLVLVALGLGWLFRIPPFGTLQVTMRDVAWGALATLPPLIALAALLRSPSPRLGRMVEQVELLVGPLFEGAPLWALGLVSILAGVGEESLFRGVLQPGLASVAGPWVALVAVSALFGLVHFVTATYAFLAGLIGLYLGWLFMASGNLLVPIVVHALYDLVALRILVARIERHGRNDRLQPD